MDMGNVVYLEARLKPRLVRAGGSPSARARETGAAFEELQRALAEQREACQSFKAEVKRLDTAIGQFCTTIFRAYRSSLSEIDTQPLRAKSLRLARLADQLGEQADDLTDLTKPQPV